MANVSSSNGIEKYPKLRFPQYIDSWDGIRFGDLIEEFSHRTKVEDEDVLLSAAIEGMFLNTELFGHQRGASNKGYKKIEYGTLVLSTQNLHLGNANVNLRFEHGMVSPAYKTYRIKNCSVTLLAEWIKSEKAKQFFYDATTVGASVCRRNVEWETLYDQTLYLPTHNEQKHIAEFLSLVSERIRKQEKFIDCLKKYKRGVISKLFSREIRFTKKDGSSFPEWREYPLDSVVEFLDGQRKPLESAERANRKGAYPYYGASGIIDYIDNYIFDEPLLLLGEDGANIITRSSPLCFIATGKYWVNNHAHVMRPKQGFDLRFVCEALESIDYTKYNTGTAQPKLNQEKCRQILFTYPCYEEQQCISSFLSSITKRIMDSEEQLSLLATQKKSLLQQLFI